MPRPLPGRSLGSTTRSRWWLPPWRYMDVPRSRRLPSPRMREGPSVGSDFPWLLSFPVLVPRPFLGAGVLPSTSARYTAPQVNFFFHLENKLCRWGSDLSSRNSLVPPRRHIGSAVAWFPGALLNADAVVRATAEPASRPGLRHWGKSTRGSLTMPRSFWPQ